MITCIMVLSLQKYLTSGDYDDVEDLEQKLAAYKSKATWFHHYDCYHKWNLFPTGQFMEFDEDDSGDIG